MQFSTYATPAHLSAASVYLAASDVLLSEPSAREPNARFSDPANFLVAHGAELSLKAYLSWSGIGDSEVKALGHNLAKAFQKIGERDSSFAKSVNGTVSTEWRKYLKDARTAHIAPFADFGVTSEESLAELGVPSTSEIGEQHPTFVRDLQWLSERHRVKGGKFRYLQFGHDSGPVIKVYGLNECTVPKSVRWGCQYILDTLDRELRKRRR